MAITTGHMTAQDLRINANRLAARIALQRFDGVRRYTLPMKDSPAGRAMSVGFTLVKT